MVVAADMDSTVMKSIIYIIKNPRDPKMLHDSKQARKTIIFPQVCLKHFMVADIFAFTDKIADAWVAVVHSIWRIGIA